MTRLGLVGSFGTCMERIISNSAQRQVTTPHGLVTTRVGFLNNGHEVVALTRSGGRPGIAPHRVNYRANTLALKQSGVTVILATGVVGSLTREIPAGTLVVLDQFLDFTSARPKTLWDREGFALVDMTEPYCLRGRTCLVDAARELGVPVRPTGCYVAVDGPRFETRAEVQMYRQLGGDVIGDTSVPEAVMAREAGMCYASLAFTANLAAGILDRPVSRSDIQAAIQRGAENIRQVVAAALIALDVEQPCQCQAAADDFVSTDSSVTSPD
jgi:5'-methylthioadenosine phosphorylase